MPTMPHVPYNVDRTLRSRAAERIYLFQYSVGTVNLQSCSVEALMTGSCWLRQACGGGDKRGGSLQRAQVQAEDSGEEMNFKKIVELPGPRS